MIKPSEKQKAFMDFKANENTIKLASIRTPREAKPSEAMVYIDAFIEENNNDIKNQNITGFDIDTQEKWVKYLEHKSFMLSTIKQALLKAQEMEKDVIHYKGTIQNLRRDNTLLKDIKNEQEKENTELKEVLSIIKENNIDIETLKYRLRVKDDDVYLHYKYDKLMPREKFNLLKRLVEND